MDYENLVAQARQYAQQCAANVVTAENILQQARDINTSINEEQITALQQIKTSIKNAIVQKGVVINEQNSFAEYADKILLITTDAPVTALNFYKCTSINVNNKTWTGYKAILNNNVYSFEQTETENLTYNDITPVVGKIYSEDTFICVEELFIGKTLSDIDTVFLIQSSSENLKQAINNITPTSEGNVSINNGVIKLDGGYYKYSTESLADSLNFGTDKDFTVQYVASVNKTDSNFPSLICNRDYWSDGTFCGVCFQRGNYSVYWNPGDPLMSPNVENPITDYGTNLYRHTALVRKNNKIMYFVDGQLYNSCSNNNLTANFAQNSIYIGQGIWDGGNGYYYGNLLWLRISNTARYTADFTTKDFWYQINGQTNNGNQGNEQPTGDGTLQNPYHWNQVADGINITPQGLQLLSSNGCKYVKVYLEANTKYTFFVENAQDQGDSFMDLYDENGDNIFENGFDGDGDNDTTRVKFQFTPETSGYYIVVYTDYYNYHDHNEDYCHFISGYITPAPTTSSTNNPSVPQQPTTPQQPNTNNSNSITITQGTIRLGEQAYPQQYRNQTLDLTGKYNKIDDNTYQREDGAFKIIKRYVEGMIDLWNLQDGYYWTIFDSNYYDQQPNVEMSLFIKQTDQNSTIADNLQDWQPFYGYEFSEHQPLIIEINNNDNTQNHPIYQVYGCEQQDANGLYYLVDKYDYKISNDYDVYYPKYANENGYELKAKQISDFENVSFDTTLYTICKNDEVYALTEANQNDPQYDSIKNKEIKIAYPKMFAYNKEDVNNIEEVNGYDSEHCSVKIAKKICFVENKSNNSRDGEYHYIGKHLLNPDDSGFYSEIYTNGQSYLWYDRIGLFYVITKADPSKFNEIYADEVHELLWDNSIISDGVLGVDGFEELFVEGISDRGFEDGTVIKLYY